MKICYALLQTESLQNLTATPFPDHSVMVSLIYFSSYLLSHPLFILKIKVQYPLGIFVLFFEIYGQPHESTLYI